MEAEIKYFVKCLAQDVLRNRSYKEIRLTELVKEINKIKFNCEEVKDLVLNIKNIRNYLTYDDSENYQIKQNRNDKSYYFKHRYLKDESYKKAMVEIMTNRNNERLELGECVKMLTEKSFEGLTVRNIRRRLNLTANDKYEIKRIGKNEKYYIIHKNE